MNFFIHFVFEDSQIVLLNKAVKEVDEENLSSALGIHFPVEKTQQLLIL